MQDTALIDHHCHGVVTKELGRDAFEALMSESYRPPAPGTTQFQKPLGLAIRRHCAPVLGLEPLASVDDYVARRSALGADEVNRRLLAASGVATHLIDTGHRALEISSPEQFAALSGHAVREIVRIEAVAEEVAAAGCAAADYPSTPCRSAQRSADRAQSASRASSPTGPPFGSSKPHPGARTWSRRRADGSPHARASARASKMRS